VCVLRHSYHFVSGVQAVYVQYVSPPIFSATDVVAVFGLEDGIVAEPPAGHLRHQEDDHVRGRQSIKKKMKRVVCITLKSAPTEVYVERRLNHFNQSTTFNYFAVT